MSVAATDPIKLSDHTALTAELATKVAKGSYTDDSYAVYEAAYNEAIYINNQNTASAEALGAALQKLIDARAALTLKTNIVNVVRRTIINGTTQLIDTLR